MCGITGIFRFDGRRAGEIPPVDPAQLTRMRDSLEHRGPDDAGSYLDPSGRMGLAMRRLAVISPEDGHQPLFSEDKSLVLVCNGEIYNYRQLRRELSQAGHGFATGSDAEVILHLYEEHGPELVHKLRGMFAFALWDGTRQRLMLARDRIGIKPLYFATRQGSIYFGSELKALLESRELPRRINRQALHHYLSLNYIPAPYTLFEQVQQLQPGEMMLCDGEGPRRIQYWDLDYESESLGEAEWVQRIKEKLGEAVESHLVADVPFGAFLSGGIDSASVVGLMSGVMDDPVQTFTIDFAEESYGEAAQARAIANHFAATHHETRATADIVDLLDRLIWYADDPLADSSMLPVYLVAHYARQSVTMVLTGDGGDEVFAGYETYNAYFVRQLYRCVPSWVRKNVVRRVVDALPVSMTKVSFDYKAKRFVEGAELDPEEAHFWWRAIFSEEEKRGLYSDPMQAATFEPSVQLYRQTFGECKSDDPLSRLLYLDTRLYLPADMLVKVDRMTMANGLEARVPFLDHELVELVARAPSALKLKRQRKKHLLKEAMRGLVPGEVLDRKKAGFNVPVNRWLTGELADFARNLLTPERLGAAGVFRPEVVGALLDAHQAHKADNSYRLWGLMCFQLWYERFIAPSTISQPS